uniref:Uncharacterized protein n=1 Tax=Anopheles dirus TaxID=7168 RepID=A0A182MZ44_9DIPT
MSKILFVAATLVGYCALFSEAGSYYYNNQPHPAGPPPPQPLPYLPNYDVVLPPPDYETVNVAHGWENLPWKPVVQFPWPGPEEHHGPHHHYPPHYHYGSKTPCPNKHYVKTTTTRKPTTTTTTTTTTTPRPTKKHHLADLSLTHGHKNTRK